MTEPVEALAAHPRMVAIGDRTQTWGIALEVPVEITLNGEPWTVLLASPESLEDLAVGLAVTEGVLRDVTAVEAIHTATFLRDVRVDLRIPTWAIDATAKRARTLVSGTACGLCGIESLAQLEARRPVRSQPPVPVADAAIRAALEALPALQPLNQATRSVHVAAWCTLEGTIQLAREDVGRHNALDKLVGALARMDRLAEQGFILMSSRGSYELVAKAAALNAQLLATVSAPTALALTWADALQLPLASTVRTGDLVEVVRFPHSPVPPDAD
ncbi:MAG: formate dehydrogenase accessory sulfurtransferase FdhD [Gemmatimonadaceae bacterium]|nr:formate dehydrogenase accessory sulfurtransferase FdhD [Gemmatimonadaceae bacterium]